MSSSERQRLREARLQEETEELGSDLNGTVEAVVHKADLPSRARERSNRAIDAAERARETVSQTPTDRWAKLAAAGVALVLMIVIVRRVRAS
jgi:hypothetical protein